MSLQPVPDTQDMCDMPLKPDTQDMSLRPICNRLYLTKDF
jgi:hypothetical protein